VAGTIGQQHVARDAAVVPPVGVDGRDLVGLAGVVGLDDDDVAALVELPVTSNWTA